jgi:hypothetical protein
MQAAGLHWPDAVDAVQRGCCTLVLHPPRLVNRRLTVPEAGPGV